MRGDEVLMLTSRGYVKSFSMKDLQYVRPSGKGLIVLKDDRVVDSLTSSESRKIQVITKQGKLIVLERSKLKTDGSRGTRVIKLKSRDEAVSISSQDFQSLIVTERGYAKAVVGKHFPLQKKGNAGVKALSLDNKTGEVLFVGEIEHSQFLLLTTLSGKVFKLKAEHAPEKSRQSKPARMATLSADDRVMAVELS